MMRWQLLIVLILLGLCAMLTAMQTALYLGEVYTARQHTTTFLRHGVDLSKSREPRHHTNNSDNFKATDDYVTLRNGVIEQAVVPEVNKVIITSGDVIIQTSSAELVSDIPPITEDTVTEVNVNGLSDLITTDDVTSEYMTSRVGITPPTAQRTDAAFTGYYEMPKYAVWVNSSGSFLDKISLYNTALEEIRKNVWIARGLGPWEAMPRDPMDEIPGNGQDFLKRMSLLPGMYTVILAWSESAGLDSGSRWSSRDDAANLLIQDYYPLIGSDEFCHSLRHLELTSHRWDTQFNRECTTNVTMAMLQKSMDIYFLNSFPLRQRYITFRVDRFPSHMYTDLPRHIHYVHVFRDAYVTALGNVYTSGKKSVHKIVPYSCKPKLSMDWLPETYQEAPLHDEVFVIGQLWAHAYYHRLLECIPRLAPSLDFLRRHPSIKIVANDKEVMLTEILDTLGISPSRLVQGPVRTKVVYLPQVSFCHMPHIQAVQYLAHVFKGIIQDRMGKSGGRQLNATRRNLILIRRSQDRHFSERDEIASRLRELARDYGLRFYWFRDDPVPALPEVMSEFYQAVMVVAPHGAGLSNLLFSQPGTQVIEGLCHPPETNMCFTRLAHILGMRYHGLISKAGCEDYVDIPADEVLDTSATYLKIMRQNGVI